MSRKYIFNSGDKTLSPSQVYLEKLSSGVFRDLFSSGSCGYNNLLQREEATKSPQRSPYQRSKTKVKCGGAFAKRSPPSAAPRKVGGVCKPAQSSRIYSNLPNAAACLAVEGRSVDVSSRAHPKLRQTCTLRAVLAREAESARRCVLSAVKPTNVESEKVKFFKSGFSYSPQFEYSSPASSLVLARHSSASDRFLSQVSSLRQVSNEGLNSRRACPRLQAVHILELVLQRYGSYEAFERLTGGSLLTKSRIWHKVKKYMEKEGCVGEVGEPSLACSLARSLGCIEPKAASVGV